MIMIGGTNAGAAEIDWGGAGYSGTDGADGGQGGATLVGGGAGGSAASGVSGHPASDGVGGDGAAGTFGGQGGAGGAVGAAGYAPTYASDTVTGANGGSGQNGGAGGGGGAGLVYDSTTASPTAVGGIVTIHVETAPGAADANGIVRGGNGGMGSCVAGTTNCGGGGGGGAGLVIRNDGDYTIRVLASEIIGGAGGSVTNVAAGGGGGGAAAIIYGSSPVVLDLASSVGGTQSYIFSGNGSNLGGNSGDGLVLTNGNDVTVIGKTTYSPENKGIGVGRVNIANAPSQLGRAVYFSGDGASLTLEGGQNIFGGAWDIQKAGLAVDFKGNENRLILTTNRTQSGISWREDLDYNTINGVTLVSIPGVGNTIELHPHTSIEGILVATGADNGIALGGSKVNSDDYNSIFDLSRIGDNAIYRGLERLEKLGTSWWTINYIQAGDTPWSIIDGHLLLGNAGDISNAKQVTVGTSSSDEDSAPVLNLGQLPAGSQVAIKSLSGTDAGLIDDCSAVLDGDTTCGPTAQRSNAKLVITDGLGDEFAGKIQTGGGFEVAGGTQIFTGNVENLGGVTVSGGVLQLGNGGNGGSLSPDQPVDVSGMGRLVFNRAETFDFDNVITGNGQIEQAGALYVKLGGDGSGFTGNTLVRSGGLYVGGVLGGNVSVQPDAELAGDGTIVGNTTIADGAKLMGRQGRVLTIQGDLVLSSGSLVDVTLGLAPNTAGLFDVGGNLTLAGKLNIEGIEDFGPGLYRLFDYGGTLLGSGLTLGNLPQGTDPQALVFETDSAHVYLNYTGSAAAFNSWDGGNVANQDNDRVDGGDGIWDADNLNWTTPDGHINGKWTTGNYALFSGSAGVVTVNDGAGGISARGLVFSTSGYHLNGGYITLAGDAGPTIRVGDGTQSGVSMTATIATELRGTQGMKKVDHGTLILTGENTYTGGTIVSEGQLQIGDGGSAGSIVGDVQVESDIYGYGVLSINRSDEYVFAGAIGGGGVVVQKGEGVTIFSGNNTYSGGLTVERGTAKAGIADAAFGSGPLTIEREGQIDLGGFETIVGGLAGSGGVKLGGGALILDQDTNSSFSGTISEDGDLIKNGSGTLTLAGLNTYAGATAVNGGTLLQGGVGAFNSASAFTVGSTGKLNLGGIDATVASLRNSGEVQFGGAGGTSLTVNGDYVGNDGTLVLNSVLYNDASKTDRLIVKGDTEGHTNLKVIDRNGSGAQTVEGIKIIDVAGRSTGSFSLSGDFITTDGQQAVVAGAYAYTLHQGGSSTPDDGDWYLRSEQRGRDGPRFSPGVPVYQGVVRTVETLNELPTLRQRVGSRHDQLIARDKSGNDRAQDENIAGALNKERKSAAWGRVEGAHNRFASSLSGATVRQDINSYVAQAGIDGMFFDGARGVLIGGVNAQYRAGHSSISSSDGSGSIDTQAGGPGVTLTWYGTDGFYVDGQLQAMWYSSNLYSRTTEKGLANDVGSFGYALSLETGKRFALNGRWAAVPQLQLTWSSISFDDFNDTWGASITSKNNEQLRGRAGFAVEYNSENYDGQHNISRTKLYGIANLYHELSTDGGVSVENVYFDGANDRTWAGLGAGGVHSWSDDRYALYGEGSIATSLNHAGDNYGLKGTVGFTARW